METLYDFFAKPKDPKHYNGVRVALASSEQIRQWSHGEIKKPETLKHPSQLNGFQCFKKKSGEVWDIQI